MLYAYIGESQDDAQVVIVENEMQLNELSKKYNYVALASGIEEETEE